MPIEKKADLNKCSIEDSLKEVDVPIPEPVIAEPVKPEYKFIDLREEQTDPAPRSKVRGGKTVIRNPEEVTGICIHQMAVTFGIAKHQLRAAGGDRDLAKARRFMRVPAHACISRDGFYSIHSDMRAYLYHGHSFNAFTLGVEIEGNYAGIEDKPWTAWKGADNAAEFTEKTLECAKVALERIVREGREMGMPIKYIYAHRQTYKTKRGDPGGEIWRRLVLEYAVPELGLEVQNEKTWRDGKPIPLEWDPDKGIGKY